MKMKNTAIFLTAINLVLLIFLLTQLKSVSAQEGQGIPQVLRGHSLEIVDSSGRVRASIKVEPAVTMEGKFYPQTAILRLIDTEGGPLVKLGASENGGGLNLSNRSDGGVQIIANSAGSFIKIKNKDGKERVVNPE
jgi:hypothetical protein